MERTSTERKEDVGKGGKAWEESGSLKEDNMDVFKFLKFQIEISYRLGYQNW